MSLEWSGLKESSHALFKPLICNAKFTVWKKMSHPATMRSLIEHCSPKRNLTHGLPMAGIAQLEDIHIFN